MTRLIIVSGPSGVGKSTVLKRLIEICELPLVMNVSATTRQPRDLEKHGIDYHFLTDDQFTAKREAGEFLECCEVFGRGDWYGTLKSSVDTSLRAGKWVVLEIDVEGARKVSEVHPDVITIFVGLNSLDDVEQRLRDRGTEDEETIRGRLETAEIEMKQAASYQYFVINDEVERAAHEICHILEQINEASGVTDA